MNAHIITENVNGVTNYISLNAEGQLVTASLNPMELPGFMSKEQAFKVIAGLRQAATGTETKYRVKAVSQALRDMITDIIVNKLPGAPMVEDTVIEKALESWKPKKVETKKADEQPAEAEAEPEQAEVETQTAEDCTVSTEEGGSSEDVQQIDTPEVPVEQAKPETKKSSKKKNK